MRGRFRTSPDPATGRGAVGQQGFANVGFHNPKNVHTPATDKLAAAGIILDRHYTFRWCAPTRSALMTGRLPSVPLAALASGGTFGGGRHSPWLLTKATAARDGCAPPRHRYHVLQSTNHVHRSFNMLPAKLRQVGYRTHQIGKW